MHDALAAERRGIPAAAVMTDRFVTTAEAVIELNGLKAYPYVVIPHPISSDSDDELRAKALASVERIVSVLTERADPGP
jgi:hypothetical protein